MADQLATPADLAAILQVDLADIPTATATLLLECATAVVQQAAGGQRIVQVTETCSLMSTSDSWLDLPQIPVTAVSAVVLDGVTLTVNTDYKVFGNRLWRSGGWQNNLGWQQWEGWDWRPSFAPAGNPFTGQEPSLSTITYTHGYAAGAQQLQLGRSMTLSLARAGFVNVSGVSSESIDDYSVSYEAMASMVTPFMRKAIRSAYGRRAGLVRVT